LNIELDFNHIVKVDASLTRPTDVTSSLGDPKKIKNELGWRAKTSFEELIQHMLEFQITN
jgi:GDPmannose 4,6-dehydratase